MQRKSQKSEKKSLEIEPRGSSGSFDAVLPQEKPAHSVSTRNNRANSEAKQSPPFEKSKMADNWDRLMVRTAADRKLPMATSSKSASNQLEVLHPRQARRSRDVSREMENAETDNVIEAALAIAHKRSRTPLPSIFEDNKKTKMSHLSFDNSKSKPVDQKQKSSKHVAGKSLKKSELQLNQNKENAKSNENPTGGKGAMVRVPLSQTKGQGPAPKAASSVADIEEAACESMEISARGMLGPSGNDSYFLEQFHKFYADYKACNAKLAKRLLKLDTSNTQKHYENVSLKNRLTSMTDQIKNLESRLSLQEQLNSELHDKFLGALKTRTTVERECKSQLERAKSLIDQQKAELDGNQSEIDRLRDELKNMQEANCGMTKAISDLQIKLKNTEETASKLLDQNNKKEEELGKQKLEIESLVAGREVSERRISELESELGEKILECNNLQQCQEDYDDLQSQNEEMANQLEDTQTEKETVQNFLNERIQELEASRNVLIDINEEYSRETMELKAENAACNDTLSILKTTLIQQADEVKLLTETQQQLQEANLQQLSLHSAELEAYEAQKTKLEEMIKKLESKLQVQAQSLIAEQETLIEETQKGQELKTELEAQRERYQADIDALKTALEHRDNQSSAEQAKMEKLEAELEELKKINTSLKDENKQKDNDISAAKKMFDEEIKHITNNLKKKIFGLQEDLKHKETKLIGLEHEKNGIIKQLKLKMSTICSTIEQPIIASGLARSPEPDRSLRRLPRKGQEVKPIVLGSPSSSGKKRRAHEIDYINIESDFESEEDDVPIKKLFTKRENLAVVMPQNDLFDSLKNGTV